MVMTATEVAIAARALEIAREAGWVPYTIERVGEIFEWRLKGYRRDVEPTQYAELMVDASFDQPSLVVRLTD